MGFVILFKNLNEKMFLEKRNSKLSVIISFAGLKIPQTFEYILMGG